MCLILITRPSLFLNAFSGVQICLFFNLAQERWASRELEMISMGSEMPVSKCPRCFWDIRLLWSLYFMRVMAAAKFKLTEPMLSCLCTLALCFFYLNPSSAPMMFIVVSVGTWKGIRTVAFSNEQETHTRLHHGAKSPQIKH